MKSSADVAGPISYTLITVTYNNSETLERCWTHRLPDDVQWIVVDNASTDDSAEVARRLGAQVIRADRNLGFSGANNLGLRHARGGFIGFVNPDVTVDPSGLVVLADEAEARGALVAPQLLNEDGTEQPNGRGYPLLSAKIRNRLRGGDPRYLLRSLDGAPRTICWAMGAAIFGRRADLERMGGWDSRFFLYYEDKDFCLRGWKLGIPTILVPSVRWQHGWARETTSFRWAPWRRELASMAKFYGRYPEFLLGYRSSARAHPGIESAVFRTAK